MAPDRDKASSQSRPINQSISNRSSYPFSPPRPQDCKEIRKCRSPDSTGSDDHRKLLLSGRLFLKKKKKPIVATLELSLPPNYRFTWTGTHLTPAKANPGGRLHGRGNAACRQSVELRPISTRVHNRQRFCWNLLLTNNLLPMEPEALPVPPDFFYACPGPTSPKLYVVVRGGTGRSRTQQMQPSLLPADRPLAIAHIPARSSVINEVTTASTAWDRPVSKRRGNIGANFQLTPRASPTR